MSGGPRHNRALLEAQRVNFTEPPADGSTIRVLGRDVRVEYHPGLSVLGLMGSYTYEGDFAPLVIRLREWNERVFLHELLHLLVGYPHLFETSEPLPNYPLTEWMVGVIEDGLWDLGWRWHGPETTPLPPAAPKACVRCGKTAGGYSDYCPTCHHEAFGGGADIG